MLSADSLNKTELPETPFDNGHLVKRGEILGNLCKKLSKSISYCVIDDEMWIWNHDNQTIFKLNPNAKKIVFNYLSGKELDIESLNFIKNELSGVFDSDLFEVAEDDTSLDANATDSFYAFSFLRKLAMERHVPLFPALELLYLCNYDCIHCYRPQERPDLMSLDRWKGVISELKDEGTLGVVLTGGEVTAWKHIKELITYIRSMRMAFVFKTNGHLIDQEWVDFLVESRCHEVHISLYGSDRESNDYVTQRKGSYDRIVNAIRSCAEAGLKVRISSSLTEKTFPHYQKIIDLAKELEVGLNIDPMLSPSASVKINTKAIRINQQQIRHFCDGLGDTLAPEFQTLRAPGAPVCSAARSNCSIAPNGNVYPCVGYWYKEETISILNSSFKSAWANSPILNTVRKITNDKLPTCSQCKFREFCPRCLGAGYEETGNLYGISPNNCAVAEGVYENYQNRKPTKTSVGLGGSFGNRCS